jgi:error-prone DNA polymerase
MAYVELHCHSTFSFLDGASHPIELAGAAADLGHGAMALTDHDGLYGSMEFAIAAKTVGVRPITGAELMLDEGSHLTLLCADRTGYTNLCKLITAAHRGTRDRPADPLPPSVSFDEVARYAEGLVCLSGCATNGPIARAVERGDHAAAAEWGRRLLAAFGRDRLRIELQRPFARNDRRRNRLLAQLAERLGVPCVATGNVHAHARSRVELQDAFVAVRLRSTLDETEPMRRGNASHVLASADAMADRFREHPDAVEESGRLAERLRFDITSDLGYQYPGAEDADADRKLAELCWARIGERYEGRGSIERAQARLDEELKVIRSLGLSGFFLLHRDLLELAREVAVEVRGPSTARALLPPGRGRGSSVASIVCYLTGLSHIDPVEKELFLGRFLNEELTALPDIDLDFPRDIREVLIPRVHERYGHDKSALVAAFSCYHVRGAVRDFGKALGLAPGEVERVARTAEPWGDNPEVERDASDAIGAARAASPRWQALMRLVREAIGLPRHASQHPGGMVISTQPLDQICPIQPCAMEGRQMVQWEKESCADAGFLKIDLLGLGMLSAVERCVDEIARVRGDRVDLSRIPYDDKAVYSSIQKAETMGVFQIESRAQMQMLTRTLPASLDDLTVQVALVRPGPIQGGAVHPYIERRKALRADPDYKVPYEHPSLEPVLKDTLGAIVFQDQVIEVAMAFAGFTPGEAEGLRRAMSKRRSEEAMRAFATKFVDGAVARGAPRDVAERVYGQIVGFSGFGFPKAHSAAFGLLAYQSTWLRVHYGPEFLCALLNEQPMGFYPPDSLVHEAQRRGMEVLPPDVGRSRAECTVEATGDGSQVTGDSGSGSGLAVRLGLGYVNGVAEADVRAIVADRDEQGAFASAADLAARCAPRHGSLELLAWAGACDSLCPGGRREALWQLGVAAPGVTVRGGTQLALPVELHDAPSLRELTPWERMLADYGSIKVTLREHPIELMRPMLGDGYEPSESLGTGRSGRRVRVAGLVVARQRPATANGITFMLLEDEFGSINLIVPPPVYEACRSTVRAEPLVWATGRLERREGVTNILVDEVGRLERPDLPLGEVRHIEPKVRWSNEQAASAISTDDLRAVVPAGHAFGRRG